MSRYHIIFGYHPTRQGRTVLYTIGAHFSSLLSNIISFSKSKAYLITMSWFHQCIGSIVEVAGFCIDPPRFNSYESSVSRFTGRPHGSKCLQGKFLQDSLYLPCPCHLEHPQFIRSRRWIDFVNTSLVWLDDSLLKIPCSNPFGFATDGTLIWWDAMSWQIH